MLNKTVIFLFIAAPFFLHAQQGDELLAYSVKGKVTVVYKNEEAAVKIGKVLKPGAVIKTQKDASLTMLCNKGKPLSVTKEGSFPVNNWKDSCRTPGGSVTSNYFKYIWNQLYAYSPEYKEEMRKKNDMAVSRGDPPPKTTSPKKARLSFSKGMDTVNYDGENFPLSWTGSHFQGKYLFTLYNAKGDKVLFGDSLRQSYISIDSFQHLLEPGKSYRWNVTMKGMPASKKRVLVYIPAGQLNDYMINLFLPVDVPEDTASQFFRVAWMLELKHYLAEALIWYQKAAVAAPDTELFRDQLIRFRNEFWIR
ncbi:MAG: hypothetical protein ACT4OJ_16300 [Bacteroidota bacterium]